MCIRSFTKVVKFDVVTKMVTVLPLKGKKREGNYPGRLSKNYLGNYLGNYLCGGYPDGGHKSDGVINLTEVITLTEVINPGMIRGNISLSRRGRA
jgi:hypothetical protein